MNTQRLNGTLTPAQIGSALVPNRSNASGLMVSSWGPKIMGQTITNSYGDLEVLQAYKK
jgi:hypothetical protein